MFGLISKFTEAPSITPWVNVKKLLTAEEIILHEEELLARVFLACVYPHTGRKIGVPLFGSKTMRETLWYAARYGALADVLSEDLSPRLVSSISDRGRANLDKVYLLSQLMRAKFSSEEVQRDFSRFTASIERKLIVLGIPVLQTVLTFLLSPASEESEAALHKFEES